MVERIRAAQFHEQEGLDDWRVVLGQAEARFRADSFPAALAFVQRIGAAAEAADHHPDVDIRWNRVLIRLSTHSAGGVTDRDVALAGRISGLA